MLRSDDRFARQNRFGLPPWFPVASPCPSIDHHLSGRVLLALDQSCIYSKTVRGCETPFWRSHQQSNATHKGHIFHFHFACALSMSDNTCKQLTLLGPCFKTGWREHWIRSYGQTGKGDQQISFREDTTKRKPKFSLACIPNNSQETTTS